MEAKRKKEGEVLAFIDIVHLIFFLTTLLSTITSVSYNDSTYTEHRGEKIQHPFFSYP